MTRVQRKDSDERGQITYSSGPFRGSEAFRDACRSTLTNQRLLTGATVQHTHISIFTSNLSLSLYTLVFFSSCLSVEMLVFHHLQLSVFYRRPSSHWSWRVSACTVIVSYRQSSSLISTLLCARFFFFFFSPCLLSACFYFSTVAHNKVIHNKDLQGH